MSTWLTDVRAVESLFSASPSAIIALDQTCRVVAVNPACTLVTGYTESDLAGRDLREFADPPLQSFLAEAVRAADAKHTLQRSLSFTRKDGSAILADATSIPVAEGAQAVCLFLVIQDTSWRERVEQPFHAFFDNNPIAAVSYDAQGGMTKVNAALVEQTGYAPEHFVGRPIGSHSRPERREGLRVAFEHAMHGQIAHSQTEILSAADQWTEFEATFIPRIEGGAIVGAYGLYENVTQERAAQQRLADQTMTLARVERDFRTIFEHLPTPIIAFDRERKIIDVNPAGLRLAGYDREDVIGRCVDDFILAEPSEVANQFRDVLSGTIVHSRARGRGADGELLFDVTNVPMYSGSEVCGAYALLENITALTRTSEELDQARLQFRLLFEHNPTVVVAIDTHQRVTDVNSAGLRVSGYARDEVIGRNVADFVPPSQRDTLRQFFSQAVRGETLTFPIDTYAADGRLIQFEATALPIVSQRRIIGVYWLMENVTERIRAERTVAAQREEILDLENDFRSLFAHNPDGIALLSTEGTIIDANDAALNISKYSRDALLGQDFRNVFQGPHLERAWAFLRRAVEGETVHYDAVSTRGDSRILHLEVTLLPKHAQGLIVGIYCIFKDTSASQVAHRKIEMRHSACATSISWRPRLSTRTRKCCPRCRPGAGYWAWKAARSSRRSTGRRSSCATIRSNSSRATTGACSIWQRPCWRRENRWSRRTRLQTPRMAPGSDRG